MLALEFEIEYKRNPAQALAKLGKSIPDERLLSQTAQREAKDMIVGEAIDAYIDNLTGVLSQSTIRRYRKDRENSSDLS